MKDKKTLQVIVTEDIISDLTNIDLDDSLNGDDE